MKAIFNLMFILVTVPYFAQAIPDYTNSAFGLSYDVVKTEEKSYKYDPSSNSYSVDFEETMTFENGLLKQKQTIYKGYFGSNITTDYSYNNGKIIKEIKNADYSGTSTQTTTNYFYQGNKLIKKTEVDNYQTLTSIYNYDNKGIIANIETKKDDGKLYSLITYTFVKDEKNYTKNTKYYHTTNGDVSNDNTEVFVNGKYISFISDSKEYGKSTYKYVYDNYGNVIKGTNDDIIVEENKYITDIKGNWIQCKSYQENWLAVMGDVYKFRKITFKNGSSGSTDLDHKFINDNPSKFNKPYDTQSTTSTTPSNITKKSAANPGCDGNCQDGYGTYYYSDGNVYYGFFSNGLRNGPGTITFENGDVYYGNWLNGLKEGYALYKWNDGSIFLGYYKNDKINGEGIYVNSNKEIKPGIFKDENFEVTYNYYDNGVTSGCTAGDCNNGMGKYVFDNGDLYVGFFTNGQLKHGMYNYSNKDSFFGEFSNGQRNGFGYYTWANNNYYMGMYQNGTYHGLGYYYVHADATQDQIGEFRNGSLYKSMK